MLLTLPCLIPATVPNQRVLLSLLAAEESKAQSSAEPSTQSAGLGDGESGTQIPKPVCPTTAPSPPEPSRGAGHLPQRCAPAGHPEEAAQRGAVKGDGRLGLRNLLLYSGTHCLILPNQRAMFPRSACHPAISSPFPHTHPCSAPVLLQMLRRLLNGCGLLGKSCEMGPFRHFLFQTDKGRMRTGDPVLPGAGGLFLASISPPQWFRSEKRYSLCTPPPPPLHLLGLVLEVHSPEEEGRG